MKKSTVPAPPMMAPRKTGFLKSVAVDPEDASLAVGDIVGGDVG